MAETHIDKIMKLLVLSGKKNPNEHERENALEMATRLMARHNLTIDDMRSRYRDWAGLPPKAPPGRSTSRSRPYTNIDDLIREAHAAARAQREMDAARKVNEKKAMCSTYIHGVNTGQLVIGGTVAGIRRTCSLCDKSALGWMAVRRKNGDLVGMICGVCYEVGIEPHLKR